MARFALAAPPTPTPTRTLLAKEQARIREQYEERLRELEAERQGVAEDKAQVGAREGTGIGLGLWRSLLGGWSGSQFCQVAIRGTTFRTRTVAECLIVATT